MFGVLFTLASLAATALTLRAGQEELRTAQQGQITDRYTKAIEQLGSGKPEVRLGGIYALERLLTDSARDRRTILEVLASYVRVHAQDRPPVGSDKTRLAVDAQAALTVIGRNYQARKKENFRLDLANVDLHRKNLNSMRLTGADLTGADLTDTILIRANLAGAVLYTADLTGAYLIGANLTGTGLSGNLTGAFLADADLRGAYLIRADLKDADLRGADLRGAYLIDPDLKDADLRGADLRGMQGTAAEMVKRAAKTDATTRFV
jgi:hypothetical protein